MESNTALRGYSDSFGTAKAYLRKNSKNCSIFEYRISYWIFVSLRKCRILFWNFFLHKIYDRCCPGRYHCVFYFWGGCDRQRACRLRGVARPPDSFRTVPLDCTVAVAVRLGLRCVTTLATGRGWICLTPHPVFTHT